MFFFWLVSVAIFMDAKAQNQSVLKLWYKQPDKQWVEALPVGNGRLGAMIYGDPVNEVIQLNEETLWAGSPNRNDNPDAIASSRYESNGVKYETSVFSSFPDQVIVVQIKADKPGSITFVIELFQVN